MEKGLYSVAGIPEDLLSSLENREVALWVRELPGCPISPDVLARFIALPWRLVVCEISSQELIKELEAGDNFAHPLIHKRGFVQLVDGDPSRLDFPERCLPIFLLNGRTSSDSSTDFAKRLRRLTMVDGLRRSGPRQILVVSGNESPVPAELSDLWSTGFRARLLIISDSPNSQQVVESWIESVGGAGVADLIRLSASEAITSLHARYTATFPESRRVIRMRDRAGTTIRLDVSELDEPERPILANYSLIEEKHLTSLLPTDLTEQDVVEFFRNPESSWRPFAAGLPWIKDPQCRQVLKSVLQKLDDGGADENRIAFISAESGAGGTTLARQLAWECAREGYPVLVANQVPFNPDALPISSFLNRARVQAEGQFSADRALVGPAGGSGGEALQDPALPRYETPWVLVFDSMHWQHRDGELVKFRSELEKSGRPVCLLVVTGPMLGLSFFNGAVFKKVAELNHSLAEEEALQLGRHLNKYLKIHGRHRQESQWSEFYQAHTIRYLEGTAAFWVTLSFWIQGQYDLSESIQQWMYRAFKQSALDLPLQRAVLEIAAMSSERLPLQESLLPSSGGKWPLSQLLEDARAALAPLGLVRISSDGEKYWALAHDILGRFLVNAVFYDVEKREDLGFVDAQDAEHLRFMLLRQVSQKPALGERAYRAAGEDFATTIFKVDPDHGHGSFTLYWREVLASLDSMPRSLRDTSRVFRHHSAISRRRIAKLDERVFGVTDLDRIALLERAVEDIDYALGFIAYTPGSESNLNLYNSIANAYFDLARIEASRGASSERVSELRAKANEATRRAYAESPTNSFVIETYVRNLLQNAQTSPGQAADQCIEALGIVYSALSSNQGAYRASQLSNLGDQALTLLLRERPQSPGPFSPTRPVDVLVRAWTLLAQDRDELSDDPFSDIPEGTRLLALEALAHPAGQGNAQVLRLSYDLTAASRPYSYRKQLDYLEQLQATGYSLTPQQRLELAILQFQVGRAAEGDRVFRSLRQLWRDSEHFVFVPERLRWLRVPETSDLQVVQGVSTSDYGTRAMALVQKFGNSKVPFRPEEHGIRHLKPGMRLACHVSFGHNGPFLRPVTLTASSQN